MEHKADPHAESAAHTNASRAERDTDYSALTLAHNNTNHTAHNNSPPPHTNAPHPPRSRTRWSTYIAITATAALLALIAAQLGHQLQLPSSPLTYAAFALALAVVAWSVLRTRNLR